MQKRNVRLPHHGRMVDNPSLTPIMEGLPVCELKAVGRIV
jgi:hypothetical protein